MQVIGHIGRDSVTNQVNGKSVINFSVAHTEKFKDNAGTQQTKTIWVECAYWTDKTGIAQYLKKGTQVYVEGIPDTKVFTPQDGQTRANLTLRIGNVQLLSSGQDHAQQQPAQAQQPQAHTAQQHEYAQSPW